MGVDASLSSISFMRATSDHLFRNNFIEAACWTT